MQPIRIMLAAAILLAGCGLAASAGAQQKQGKASLKPRVIVIDPSAFRPPPPPHERTYVGPGPSLVPPMERLPQVPPLAQPPIR